MDSSKIIGILDPTRGPDYAISMGKDTNHHRDPDDLPIPYLEFFPHVAMIRLKPGDLNAVVSWCRQAWPDLEDRWWGWDFPERGTVSRDMYEDLFSRHVAVSYRFWFDRAEDATLFRMVWC